jgi:hypothetical protein
MRNHTIFTGTAHMERVTDKVRKTRARLIGQLLTPREAYLILRRELYFGSERARQLVNEWGKGQYIEDSCLVPDFNASDYGSTFSQRQAKARKLIDMYRKFILIKHPDKKALI